MSKHASIDMANPEKPMLRVSEISVEDESEDSNEMAPEKSGSGHSSDSETSIHRIRDSETTEGRLSVATKKSRKSRSSSSKVKKNQ